MGMRRNIRLIQRVIMSTAAVAKYYSSYPDSDLRVQLDCGTLLHANRSRLVAASAFFSSMFKWTFQESTSNDGVVKVSSVPLSVFQLVLLYLDTRKLATSLTSDELWELRSYATYLGIESMEQACEEYIARHLTPESCPLIWSIAEKHDAQTLSELCLKFFTDNFGAVSQNVQFLALDKTMLRRALSMGDIECDESFILQALLSWAKFQHHAAVVAHSSDGPIPPTDPRTYIQDLLPPSTLFNSRVKASVLQAPRLGMRFMM